MKPNDRTTRTFRPSHALSVTLLLAGCTEAQNQPPQTAPTPSVTVVTRAALAGTRQRVGYYADLNADCGFGGYPSVRTETVPAHGTVQIVQGHGYTNYPSTNQRYHCNAAKVPMIEIFYLPVDGYKGPDEMVLRAIYPGGTAATTKYVISVE